MKPKFESLLVEAGVQGCFSGEAFVFAVEFEGDTATLCVGDAVGIGAHARKGSPRPIAIDEATRIRSAVKAILDQPQKLAGGRSTNVLKARVVWTKGHSTTEWNTQNSDIPAAEMLDLLSSLAPDKQEAIKQAYEGYFDWSYELLKLAQSIVKERGAVE
ncbi:hypothetical protein GCM10027046_34260 [Uliginosibacterium flavum]|uniref:Uncharacterized protein n=1 Tax=Uliginosibacterium flavum TaxID=1396831 RepID=A0ABV2TML5_9RHOO